MLILTIVDVCVGLSENCPPFQPGTWRLVQQTHSTLTSTKKANGHRRTRRTVSRPIFSTIRMLELVIKSIIYIFPSFLRVVCVVQPRLLVGISDAFASLRTSWTLPPMGHTNMLAFHVTACLHTIRFGLAAVFRVRLNIVPAKRPHHALNLTHCRG